ncbi:MAG: pyridoxal-dependent decarboxylase [Gemmatimonadaceae bacterium]
MSSPLGDLDVETFRGAAHRVVDWMADYLAHPERHPVLSRAEPGDVRRTLPRHPPAGAEPIDEILADVDRVIMPGITHWNNPAFFAYFAISGSAPGILGEMISAALNVNAMLWKTSPAATELEEVVLEWLREMMGLPNEWFGVITDTASISTLLALAAAREAPVELAIRERGMAGRADLPVMRVYCSDQAHSSVDKAAITLGLGYENVTRVASDDAFRMRADLLERAMAEDVAAGRRPLAVVATTGTTSTTSIDPVRAIAAVCKRYGAWLHIDAAYGGAAATAPEMRWVLDGAELADSLVVNPHKWLFTPVDCSALYARDGDTLKRAFALVPEYLATARQGQVVDFMDYGVQLGHRFRALKLWMVIRAFGAEGIAARVREHCALARELASWIESEPDWQLSAPVPLSVVCFRHVPRATMTAEELDAHNERIMHQVNASGEAYLSHTKLRGARVLRIAIGHLRTERRHVARAWALLKACT